MSKVKYNCIKNDCPSARLYSVILHLKNITMKLLPMLGLVNMWTSHEYVALNLLEENEWKTDFKEEPTKRM